MTFSILVELAWPDKSLSPNARVHWGALSRAKKKAKDDAFWAAKYVIPKGFKHTGDRLSFVVTAYPPDKRARDDDNIVAQMKSARDGIADALGVDDTLFDQRFQWGEPVSGGKIVVEVAA